jgi:hypothetical protein
MSIGLIKGRNEPNESREETYQLVNECINQFTNKFGSSNCEALIGCDIGTEEGQEYFVENDLYGRCYSFTEEATRIALTLLAQK